MKWGDFRDYFSGFAWKRLTPHEVDPKVSNGHEFQGVNGLKDILGEHRKDNLSTTYVLLHEDGEEPEVLKLTASWYDARENGPNRSAEFRLYYPAAAGQIQLRMRAGDLMVVGVRRNGELLILLATAGSSNERQLQLLFAINDDALGKFQVRSLAEPVAMDFVTISILEQLGIGVSQLPDGTDAGIVAGLVDQLVGQNPDRLPSGDTIADLIRSSLPGVDPIGAPDEALYRWIEAEAAMFRGWEDRKIARRIDVGFRLPDDTADVQGFRDFSMSLRQSRVSRAGGALQYHFRALLIARKLKYVMEPEIDGGESPDFLFPSKAAYEDAQYPATQLRMLAAKYTAKDRWRQVLNEAKRIECKHLLTLEAGISRKQMALMSDAKLSLVIPKQIQARYDGVARASILTVGEFISLIATDQRAD
jgi:EcoRII C terminal